MKQQFLFQSLFIGLLLAGLWGCSEETIHSIAGDGSDRQNERLTINVTDGGYAASAGEKPLTRAKEEGYKTIFTTGDKVGLYVVKNNAIITGYDNICLTLSADGTWTPPAGTELFYEGAAAAYYAYYPYQADMTGKVTATGGNVTGFFKPLTDGWTPATDQSDYARYTAQDLMTGACTISNNPGNTRTLTVGLTHRMGLVIMNLPKAKYSLSTDASYTWLGNALNTKFNGFAPRQLDAGIFHYLVNPAQATLLLGTFSNSNSSTSEWSITANVAAGNYKTYTVDNGATVNEMTHTLTVGDFFMKNGTIVAGSKATLTAEEKANCIGIVFKIGAYSGDNVADYGNSLSGIHAYVVALNVVGSSPWGKANDKSNTGANDYNRGYYNTKTLLVYYNSLSSFAAKTADNYNVTCPLGEGKSKWYLPANYQLWDICTLWKNGTLNFLKAGASTDFYSGSGNYWLHSSTGINNGTARVLAIHENRMGDLADRSNGASIRPIFTF